MKDDFLAALEGAASRAKKKPKVPPAGGGRGGGEKPPVPRPEKPAPVEAKPEIIAAPSHSSSSPSKKASRLTCYLFENDVRALAGIRERLESVGHDFVNRSDAIKVALRLAATTKPEELSKLLHQVKQEDMRFKASKK